MDFEIRNVTSISKVGADEWRCLAPPENLYQSYEWMQVSEATARQAARYYCAYQQDGTLLGCLPVYRYREGGNPGYDPSRFTTATDSSRSRYPHLLYGARSGYFQRPLISSCLPPPERHAILKALLNDADRHEQDAASASFPFLPVEDARALSGCLPDAWSFRPDGAGAVLDLPRGGIDAYAKSFSGKQRNMIRREARSCGQHNVRFIEARLSERIDVVAALATATQRWHGSTITVERMREALEHQTRWLDSHSWVIEARLGAVPIGIALHYIWGTELFSRMVGLDYQNPAVRKARIYFNILFYAVVERGPGLGVERSWLGPGTLNVKVSRGCRTYPLESAVRGL
jgi:predicted N-acyltransferase